MKKYFIKRFIFGVVIFYISEEFFFLTPKKLKSNMGGEGESQ